MEKFLSIKAAAQATGLSQIFLRAGCRDGSVPHIRAGVKYLINLPLLLAQLDAASTDQKEGQA